MSINNFNEAKIREIQFLKIILILIVGFFTIYFIGGKIGHFVGEAAQVVGCVAGLVALFLMPKS